jgi:uncharacterized protein with HEPN domain
MKRHERASGGRDPRAYLTDIGGAIRLVKLAVEGATFDRYQADPILRSAVERQFITIGEALSQLLRLEPDLANGISNARLIIAFRNILVHGYADIAHDIVWSALETDMLVLEGEVDQLLRIMSDDPI